MQLAFLDFEAAFDSPHQGRLLNALRADGVPGKFVHLLDDINQRTTAAVQTPAVCTTPFDVTVEQYPGDIALAPSKRSLTDLECTDDIVTFGGSSMKLQHVIDLVSKLSALYGLGLRLHKCEQIVYGPLPLKLQVYPFVIRPVMMYESETSPAPPTTVAKIDSNGSELLKRLLGYFSPRVRHNEYLHAEVDVETNRSPCSTCFEQFVGFKLQDATRSKEEVLN
ncbi:hypothetical protein RB195_025407 [Necator americanus]|uniref:Reverse transcriptase domain-containing protein n=1 Tax=Necator americanus TaxID=51031 RepID=A0ABR1ES90_NECAM